MRLSPIGFQQLLQQNVVECAFIRRHQKKGWQPHRRMLCTLDKNLLNSLPGRISLNFTNPVYPPPYPAAAHKLVVVWDLFWQDWRAVPMESIDVVTVIPSHTKGQQNVFWAYFSTFLSKLSPQDKKAFMNT